MSLYDKRWCRICQTETAHEKQGFRDAGWICTADHSTQSRNSGDTQVLLDEIAFLRGKLQERLEWTVVKPSEITEHIINEIATDVGMGPDGWDTVDPRKIIAAACNTMREQRMPP